MKKDYYYYYAFCLNHVLILTGCFHSATAAVARSAAFVSSRTTIPSRQRVSTWLHLPLPSHATLRHAPARTRSLGSLGPLLATSSSKDDSESSSLFASNKESSSLLSTTTSTNNPEWAAQFDEALQLSDDDNHHGSSSNQTLSTAIDLLQQHAPDLFPLTRSRWDAIFSAIEVRTAMAEENDQPIPTSTSSVRSTAEFPLQSAARQEMTELYVILKQQKELKLYGAIGPDTHFPMEGSYDVSPSLLETILQLPMSALTPKPTYSILLAGVLVATVEALVSATTGIPLNVLALATLLLAVMDRLLVNGAVFESLLKAFSPGIQSKIVRHEAGHFLAAYLLGCPVEGCVLSAWAALQDRRFGGRQRAAVSAGTSFFDPELSQQINRQGKVTRRSIDRYSIIVMAGIAAEADGYGRADGGAGDEMALVAFLSQLNYRGGASGDRGTSTTSLPPWNSETIRNQARWGALQAVLMLREYKPAYEALVDALERGGKLADCIYAIEKAARDYNLKPLSRPVGYIVGDRWTTTTPDASTLSESSGEQKQIENEADSRSTSNASKEKFNEQASMEKLKQYRSEVEAKLRSIEEQLEKLKD